MPFTFNGRTWQLSDFLPYGFAANWEPFFSDLAAELTGFQGGQLRDASAASAASAGTSAQLAAQAAGSAGTGTATGLVYAAQAVNLVTATDVVGVGIYDSGRDADGGDWTNACRRTSWWREGLNTATRGARRPFPRAAALVARGTAGTLALYDLHDLDGTGAPRLWKSFAVAGILGCERRPVSGRVHFWTAGGLYALDFPGDTVWRWDSTGRARLLGGLAGFSLASAAWGPVDAAGAIVANSVADMQAIVVPGGPLTRSGLPVPTVAVATGSGATVMHHNGAAYDVTGASFGSVILLPDGRVGLGYAYGTSSQLDVGPLPYADIDRVTWRIATYGRTTPPSLLGALNNNLRLVRRGPGGEWVFGIDDRLTILAEDRGLAGQGMCAYVGTDFATGWMPGDIRAAWFCGTATGSIAAATIFSTDFSAITGWTPGAGWAHDSGNAEVDASSAAPGALLTGPTLTGLTVGQTYAVTIVVTNYSAGSVGVGTGSSTAIAGAAVNGPHTGQFTATSTSQSLFLNPITTFTGSVTSLIVQVALPDRSIKARGLAVTGTLARAAVAAGGLAAVGGFFTTNYLEQPYTADYDFTADFCVTGWINTTDVNAVLLDRAYYTGGAYNASAGWRIELQSGGVSIRTTTDGFATSAVIHGYVWAALNSGGWRQFCAVRRGGVFEMWYDGVRIGTTATAVHNLTNSNAALRVGVGLNASGDFSPGQLCAVRVTAYAPTPQQIRRMYDDERRLLVDGQPGTLAGSANVTTLAVNEDARTLAVGTADGVSIFDGLARVAYLDGASAGGAVASDSITRVAALGPHLVVGTSANAGLVSDSVIARDQLDSVRAPARADELLVAGVTTDATPLVMAPRLYVGEREVVAVRAELLARVHGATGSETLIASLSARFTRDAGGSLTLATETDSQADVRWDTGTPGAEPWLDKSSGTMAVALVVSGEFVAVQATGIAATRIEWEGAVRWRRLARDLTYAA